MSLTERKSNNSIAAAADLWCEPVPLDGQEATDAVSNYRTSVFRKVAFIIICVVLAFISAGLALGLGQMKIGFLDCYGYVWAHITGTGDGSVEEWIVYNERLPRICASLVAGAGLAIAGCVMQSVLKNPLADPYTTGISSGAGFGATLAMVSGISLLSGDYAVVANAFVFSLIPMAVIMLVSKMKGASPTVMVMAGIAVMFIFNAMTTVMKLWADPDALSNLYAWQVGTVGGIKWSGVTVMFIFTLICGIIAQIMTRSLNILSTGDESAKAMGLNVQNVRMILLLIVSLMTASIVSFTGLIGFVGLVSPHICRMFVGADNRYLVPASAMFGAMLLVVSDLIGRTIIAPALLQVGVVTAFIGGPMFLYLILRQRKEVW